MNRLGRVGIKRAILILSAFIVAGGFVLGMLGSLNAGTFGSTSQVVGPASSNAAAQANSSFVLNTVAGGTFGTSYGTTPYDNTQVIQSASTTSSNSEHTGSLTNSTSGAPSGAGGMLQFSSQVGIESTTPRQTASRVSALAYTVGGYVAYQSTYTASAYVVVRVPASQYQSVLAQIQGMGTVTSLVSNSNDVSVQYTDLNATLSSLRTEQHALLNLLNASTSINSTLNIESDLQGVNQQINDIDSQILQAKTLIDFSTINVTISQSPQQSELSIVLSATPKSGTEPLSVTFNAVVKGGAQPYVVNYNFGDGSAVQGQIVIHTYYSAGDYNVTATATDQNGTVVQASTSVHVTGGPVKVGFANFLGNVANIFVSVVEGIVEVAVVALPIAAVGTAIYIPMKRGRKAKEGASQQAGAHPP